MLELDWILRVPAPCSSGGGGGGLFLGIAPSRFCFLRKRHRLLILRLDLSGILGVIGGRRALSGLGDFLAFEGRSLIRVENRSEGHVKVEADWVSLLKRECRELTLKVVFVRIPDPFVSALLSQAVNIHIFIFEETPLVLPEEQVLSLLQILHLKT